MNASTSAGLLSARSRSGSVMFSTTSVSLQAKKARARTLAATKRSLDIVYSSTEKGPRPPSSPPGKRPGVEGGTRLLERRAQSDREGAEVRERKRVDRVDGRRSRAIQLRIGARAARQSGLRVESAITCDRKQVAAHDADLPIAGMGNRADVIRDEQLAQLRVARVLHRVTIGGELIVEPAESRKAVGRRRAPVIPDRVGVLHRLADLIHVIRQEVQVCPMEALVPDLPADVGVDQRIEVEPSEAHVLGHGEPEVGAGVTQRDVPRSAGRIARDATGAARNVALGNALPDFRFAVTQDVRFTRFNFYALVDADVGRKIWNEGFHWAHLDFLSDDVDQVGKSVENAKPIGYYWRTSPADGFTGLGGFYDQLAPNSYTVEDASYAKLREVLVSYHVGPIAHTGDWEISVVGRNLFTITGYRGFDPETGLSGGTGANTQLNGAASAAINAVDAFTFPNLRSFTIGLSSTF